MVERACGCTCRYAVLHKAQPSSSWTIMSAAPAQAGMSSQPRLPRSSPMAAKQQHQAAEAAQPPGRQHIAQQLPSNAAPSCRTHGKQLQPHAAATSCSTLCCECHIHRWQTIASAAVAAAWRQLAALKRSWVTVNLAAQSARMLSGTGGIAPAGGSPAVSRWHRRHQPAASR